LPEIIYNGPYHGITLAGLRCSASPLHKTDTGGGCPSSWCACHNRGIRIAIRSECTGLLSTRVWLT